MNLIQTLFTNYLSLSNQLAYYIGKKNAPQIDKFERLQRQEAMKLILAISRYHAIDSDEIEDEMERQIE